MTSTLLLMLAAFQFSPATQHKPIIPAIIDPDPGAQPWGPGDWYLFQTVARWAKHDLTYSFHGVPDVHLQLLRAAYDRAARMWSDVTSLNFHQVDSNGDIAIWWATSDQPASVIPGTLSAVPGGGHAVAELPNNDRPINQVINGEHAPNWSPEFATRVAVHELGHSLGLPHVDEVESEPILCDGSAISPVMCAWVFSEQTDQQPQLHQADIDAIQSLYGSVDEPGADRVFGNLSDPDNPPAPLDKDDPDGDGLDTVTEQLLTWPTGLKCDPNDPDTDDDGLPDGYEVQNLLDPTNADSDGDGENDDVEINAGTDPRSYVVVTEPGNVVAREGTPLCTLPVVGDTRLKFGLTTNDFLRAGFAFGDTVAMTARSTNGQESMIENVSITQWAGEGRCAIWMTADLQTELGLPDQPFSELLIEKMEPPGEPVLRIMHPEDGDFVPQETDLVARIRGVNLEDVYVQPFVLAPDPWRFYPQAVDGPMDAEAAAATFARARATFGGPDDDGRTFTAWVELRSAPMDIVAEGLPGLPPVCEAPCLVRSPSVQYTRGERDTDGDCISDVEEITSGTAQDALDPDVPHETPEPESIGDLDNIDDPDIWWWAREIDPSLDPREDGATWLRIDWNLAESDNDWVNISRRFAFPLRMEYCQKIEVDIQALDPQRLKVELKINDVEWVRTETFAFEAGEYKTIVVDLPESQGCIELVEVVFTVHQQHDNPEDGTYWIRDVRKTGRPSLTCVVDQGGTLQPVRCGPCGAIGMFCLPMTMLAMMGMRFRRRR